MSQGGNYIMNMLYELLNELKYQTEESFAFDIPANDDKANILVTPFVSVEYPCQTYLIVESENKDLSIINNEYLKALALAFRKADFHESDMDKNTTLVISSFRADNESLNSLSKIKIEDDPYYFKKYVLSYTNTSEQHATKYLEHKKAELGNTFLYVNEILKYLMTAEYFGLYKSKKDESSAYSYFIELATKIPAFPLNIQSSEQIKSVKEFLSEQLDNEEIDIYILDRLVSSNINFKEDSVEAILEKYDSLLAE